MITRRTGAIGGAILAGALVLAGCSGSSGGGRGGTGSTSDASGSGGPLNQTITVAHEQEFNAYNNNTADQNAVQNTVVLNQVLRGFWDFDAKGDVKADPEFGTYKKTSDDPLTVEYTIAKDAVWSDGTPIDCVDAQLAWAANSGKFASKETDDNGNPVTGFSTAGTTGYDQMNQPDCKAGDKKFTITYTTPFADWAAMFGAGTILPAHVLEQQAGVKDLIAAITDKDTNALNEAAKFYNTGWIGKKGTIDPKLYLSAGPYGFKSWQSGQSLTLEANPKWWGKAPGVKDVTIRFIDATQQATALQNGEIQVAMPQPAQDILNQLKAIGELRRHRPGRPVHLRAPRPQLQRPPEGRRPAQGVRAVRAAPADRRHPDQAGQREGRGAGLGVQGAVPARVLRTSSPAPTRASTTPPTSRRPSRSWTPRAPRAPRSASATRPPTSAAPTP